MTEHPLATMAAATSAVTTTVRRPGRRERAVRGSGIDAPLLGAPRPAGAVGGVGHGVHTDDRTGRGHLGLVWAQRQRRPCELAADGARQRKPEN
jgi:hypothetical protein